MKITTSEVIRHGEQDLIDGITADLDWGAVEDVFRKQYNLGINEDIEYKSGDIIVHNSQIAYKLEFEVKATISVLLDRAGNYLSVNILGDNDVHGIDDSREDQNAGPKSVIEESSGADPDDATDFEDGDADALQDFQPSAQVPDDLDISRLLLLSEEAPDDPQSEGRQRKIPDDLDISGLVESSKDSYASALSELNTADVPEALDISGLVALEGESIDKLSAMASQAGEMLEGIGSGK